MILRKQKKAAANLLRRSLRDSDDVCPGPDILAGYFDRSLDAQESARYELHLSQCARCREQLAALDRANAPVAGPGAHPEHPSSWAWFWDWRRLAPVAAALLVAAVWLARRPAPKPGSEPPQLVAMSQPQEALGTSAKQEGRSIPNGVSPASNLTSDLGTGGGTLKKATAPPTGKEAQTDSLKKEKPEAVGDLDLGVSNRTAPSTVSGNLRSLAPPLAKDESSLRTPGKSPEEVTEASPAETIRARPSAVEMKGPSTSAAARVSAQQVKTDAGVAPQALTLEGVARRSTGEIILTPNPKLLWRIAQGGYVERTQDGGVSWQAQLPETGAQLTAGSAPSEKICWLVGPGGVILLTTNAKDWKRIPPPVSADFVAITAGGVSSATVTTADGRKFATADAGVHWSPL